MASTHVSLHTHIIFSTKNREPSLEAAVRPRVHAYLGGVLRTLGATPLEIGGTFDHVHLITGMKPTHTISEVMRICKGESSRWIHEELGLTKFAWQDGYGAFSVSRSNVDAVIQYIRNQEEHHSVRTFQEEYRDFLEKHGVDFDEKYLW